MDTDFHCIITQLSILPYNYEHSIFSFTFDSRIPHFNFLTVSREQKLPQMS